MVDPFKQVEDNYKKKKSQFMKRIGDKAKKSNYKFKSDNRNRHIVEINSGNKLIIRAEYCVIGVYNLENNVWYWSWNLDFVDKAVAINPENMSNIQKPNNVSRQDWEKLKFYTTNGNFFTTLDRLEQVVKMALHHLDGEWILSIKHNDEGINYIEYIMLKKIL